MTMVTICKINKFLRYQNTVVRQEITKGFMNTVSYTLGVCATHIVCMAEVLQMRLAGDCPAHVFEKLR